MDVARIGVTYLVSQSMAGWRDEVERQAIGVLPHITLLTPTPFSSRDPTPYITHLPHHATPAQPTPHHTTPHEHHTIGVADARAEIVTRNGAQLAGHKFFMTCVLQPEGAAFGECSGFWRV